MAQVIKYLRYNYEEGLKHAGYSDLRVSSSIGFRILSQAINRENLTKFFWEYHPRISDKNRLIRSLSCVKKAVKTVKS